MLGRIRSVFYPYQFPEDLRPVVELARAKAEASYAKKVAKLGKSDEVLIDFMIAPITVAFALAANQAVSLGTMDIEELAQTVEQFRSSLTSDLSGISYNPFSEDEESRSRKAKFEEKCAERLHRNPGWLRHLNARVALRKAHGRRPAGSPAKVSGERVPPRSELGPNRHAEPDARSRAARIEGFKRSVLDETDFCVNDIDIVRVAGYKDTSRKQLSKFKNGTAGSKVAEKFEAVLLQRPAAFKRTAERKRSLSK
jgi:hypothetical protein